ncbi:MAG: exosortase family protein XrtF [Bacteroidota bacterium]
MFTIHKNPTIAFFIKAIVFYISWFLVYELWLHPKGIFDAAVINNLVDSSSTLLKWFGFNLMPEPDSDNIRTIGIDGTHGVWIGDPCNGLTLFALFVGFIISFPGPIKHKLWYIPAGIILIHFLNILRIVALSIISFKAPELLSFNHTYTFTIIVYGIVFVLWMVWVNKFSKLEKK